MRIFVTKNLMVLNQVDMIRCQALKRFVQLFCRVLFCAAVDLCHQENSIAVSVAKSLSHAEFTSPIVIVPAVVHKVNSVIDCTANYADTQLLVHRLKAEMPTSKSD